MLKSLYFNGYMCPSVSNRPNILYLCHDFGAPYSHSTNHQHPATHPRHNKNHVLPKRSTMLKSISCSYNFCFVSCGKVMFSSVCQEFCLGCGVPASGSGGVHPPGETPHTLGRHPQGKHPLPRDGHCSGRYASYWNAFLFLSIILLLYVVIHTRNRF